MPRGHVLPSNFETLCPFEVSVAAVICLHEGDVKAGKAFDSRVLLVFDSSRPCPLIKFPGGRYKPTDNSPVAMVTREVKEETGFVCSIKSDDLFYDLDKGNHVMRFYLTQGDINTAEVTGDENGNTTVVVTEHTLQEVIDGKTKMGFLPQHLKGLSGLLQKLKR